MSKRALPAWRAPDGEDRPVLKLYNSLTRKKETFVPHRGNHVSWYSCGPTVYDATHMGHARTYISFDILRRVLSEYFGYDVHYVMNITDIDDKIIKRARQNHLYEKYLSEERTVEKTVTDACDVLAHYETVVKAATDPDKRNMMEAMLTNFGRAVDEVKEAVKKNDKESIEISHKKLLECARDPFSEWLDSKHGASVSDNNIFTSLPRYWENEFHKDMKALNILPPDVLTRVSEFVPQIVKYIKKIIENGLAYESNGSVYFDVAAFDKREHHYYARLVPEAYGDTRSLQEGEGDLSNEASDKRSPNDFALWKRSKSGEPAWESPWGSGRPGWHIECSAMASDVCGSKLDIHTGGVDLKFPHHDNELAQSEAYFDAPGWVNYFLHTGHLSIAGCKMSKSLKNFVTVREALRRHPAARLRLAFLLHAWKDTLDYSDNTMEMAGQIEKLFTEFFLTVKDAIRAGAAAAGGAWSESERQLQARLEETKDAVHLALCDNMDTRSSLDALRGLVGATHAYLRAAASGAHAALLARVAGYVTRLLSVFGVVDRAQPIGFSASDAHAGSEEDVLPYLEALASFRARVRDGARAAGAPALLALCDQLRDDTLPALGVRLEDKGDYPRHSSSSSLLTSDAERSVVKVVGVAALAREREEAARAAAAREAARAEAAARAAEAQRARDEQRRVPPAEMFRALADKYSRFDDKGLPTHDQAGQELSKGQVKKLQKLQQAQQKKYDEYLASLNGDSPADN